MPDREPVRILDLRVADIHILDPRSRRTTTQELNQLIDGSFLTFEMSLHRAVSAVADPAVDVELLSLLPRPRPEEHALNPSGYSDMARNARHHTVEMSGASSAFMPTTL